MRLRCMVGVGAAAQGRLLSLPPFDICCCNCFVVVNAEIDCNCHRPLPMEITRRSEHESECDYEYTHLWTGGRIRQASQAIVHALRGEHRICLVIKLKINDNILCAYKYATHRTESEQLLFCFILFLLLLLLRLFLF